MWEAATGQIVKVSGIHGPLMRVESVQLGSSGHNVTCLWFVLDVLHRAVFDAALLHLVRDVNDVQQAAHEPEPKQ